MRTIKQIEIVAAKADLSGRIPQLLHNFFRDTASQEEKDELDRWLNARDSNSELFDLLIEPDFQGTAEERDNLIQQLAKKSIFTTTRLKKFFRVFFYAALVIMILDYFIPSHPISFLINGKKTTTGSFTKTTIETGNETKTIWMFDSTRIDLLPHSKLTYREGYYRINRSVELVGNANFDVRQPDGWPLRIETGDLWIEAYKGYFTFEQANDNTHGQLISQSANAVVGYDRKNTISLQPGGKVFFADGKLSAERPKN